MKLPSPDDLLPLDSLKQLSSLLQGWVRGQFWLQVVIGVDRLLDMSRTAINVAGDLVACKVIDRYAARNHPNDRAPSGGSPVS